MMNTRAPDGANKMKRTDHLGAVYKGYRIKDL